VDTRETIKTTKFSVSSIVFATSYAIQATTRTFFLFGFFFRLPYTTSPLLWKIDQSVIVIHRISTFSSPTTIRYYFSIKTPTILFSLYYFLFCIFFFFFFGFHKVEVHNFLRMRTKRGRRRRRKKCCKTTILWDFIAIKRRRVEGTTGVPCQDRRSRVILGLLTTKRLYSFPILVCDTARGKRKVQNISGGLNG
jgi:hypothetical protein